jgi:hypothetical protein
MAEIYHRNYLHWLYLTVGDRESLFVKVSRVCLNFILGENLVYAFCG